MMEADRGHIPPPFPYTGFDWTPVFTHGDLLPKNLMLPGGLEVWRAGGSLVCVIDWALAGWMPIYWEALKASWMEFEEHTDWYDMVREVFPECAAELHADWQWRSGSGVTIV